MYEPVKKVDKAQVVDDKPYSSSTKTCIADFSTKGTTDIHVKENCRYKLISACRRLFVYK